MRRGALKANIALAAIAISAGLLLLASYQGEQLPEEGQKTLLPELAQRQADSMEIWKDGHRRVVSMFRDGDGWKMHTHDSFPILAADAIRVENLQRALSSLPLQHVAESDGNDELYMNDPPDLVIIVDGKKIELGKSNVMDYRRYLRYEGNIYLAKDELTPITGNQELFYAAHDLLPRDFNPVAVTMNGKRTELAGDAATPAWLAWREARARLVEYDDRQLESEAELLQVAGRDGRQIVFIIAATEPAPMLVRPDLYLRYRLSPQLWQELIPDAEGEQGDA